MGPGWRLAHGGERIIDFTSAERTTRLAWPVALAVSTNAISQSSRSVRLRWVCGADRLELGRVARGRSRVSEYIHMSNDPIRSGIVTCATCARTAALEPGAPGPVGWLDLSSWD